MVRRRQSTTKRKDVPLDHNDDDEYNKGHNNGYRDQQGEGFEQLTLKQSPDQIDQSPHLSQPRPSGHNVRSSTTAIDIPNPASIDSNITTERSALSGQGAQYSPSNLPNRYPAKLSRFSEGFGLKPIGSGGKAINGKRSDSVDLSQAEGGAFLANIDGEPGSGHLGSSKKMASPTIMAVFVRAFKGRRLFLGLIALVVLALVVLGPQDRREQVVQKSKTELNKGWQFADEYIDKINDMRKGKPAPTPNTPAKDQSGWHGSDAKLADAVIPKPDSEPHKIQIPPMEATNTEPEANILDAVRTMPQLHPDKLKTTRCETNKHGVFDVNNVHRPLIQYAIMIDAGSTGSRVHVYRFNFCKDSPELEDETFKMIQGGLSSFKADANGAAHSLKPLLQTAMETVPESLRSCTPISVKATAGLRLLGADMSRNILDSVRSMLENEYPFPIADGPGRNGVEIMEGRDEGVFAWITVNYLLNRIGSDDPASSKDVKTAAVMDLGGASTQIVFEPIYPSDTQGMHPGEHVYELSNFGGKKYTLYQNSYLGYGLMEARKSINSLSYLSYSLAHPNMVRLGSLPKGGLTIGKEDALKDTRVPSPCFAEGMDKEVEIRVPGQENEQKITMFGTAGGYEACKRLVEVMMDKDAVCTKPPCSFGGVYQPSLMTAFAKSPIVALSYFYDRITPLGLNGTFKITDLVELTKKACSSPKEWPTHFGDKSKSEAAKNAFELLEDKPETCLDLTFLTTLLRLGYELDDSRSVTIAKKLSGNELGWCLGAQLQVLQDGIVCKRV
ncbi:uncharacterized protein FA14DRAFT_159261 [Meira miltonrushii]|uniref:guanosine-diphosphatase n=1 Tax=Meira miltonrushii TaxID=1280837 RepID=A0A316VHG0_9BASI|nr:uncharacterized protein FA14DRAFT_159261 [Meira miltonrushii]PWN37032.1 hypothetical protein FA14DRAFT_159261 [Meira miltonrushii]